MTKPAGNFRMLSQINAQASRFEPPSLQIRPGLPEATNAAPQEAAGHKPAKNPEAPRKNSPRSDSRQILPRHPMHASLPRLRPVRLPHCAQRLFLTCHQLQEAPTLRIQSKVQSVTQVRLKLWSLFPAPMMNNNKFVMNQRRVEQTPLPWTHLPQLDKQTLRPWTHLA